MSGYVVDASVAIKWFIPEVHSDVALRARRSRERLHVPAFMTLELGSVIAKKIRRGELTREDGKNILKELQHLPFQRHADERLFPAAYALALDTQQSLYDCLYLALAEAVDGRMITADRKFYNAVTGGTYSCRLMWVEDLARLT
ncbi:MAG: type II toxin-antitoxin system VapC family toxin [Nitrospira sp. CG24E]|nr:MAG: type II toxin-antitoxin system VapC family toxin [Nitrospira sp. CG24E]